ncbi:MAG: helix-turn-helix domain-containing protein [Scytonematopsis contorta HA4267-MV1]|jgi:hypothetical protein|nr:helix-turn-helix domain-containing protein [Scytonematopsis contorta HA4267-MV1]
MPKVFKQAHRYKEDNLSYKLEQKEFEKKILQHVANSKSDKASKKAKILLELFVGETRENISKRYGVSKGTISHTIRQWLSIDFDSVDSWEEKVDLTVSALQKLTKPKTLNEKEVRVIAEIGREMEDSGYKSRLSLNKEIAKEAKLKGLPDVSPRTIGRILQKTY